MEEIIKELIDEITGIEWSYGAFPASLANIRTQRIGNWSVVYMDQVIATEVTVTVSLWASTPEARAEMTGDTRDVFLRYGFEERTPASTEMLLPNNEAACLATLTFHGFIDKTTNWVYKAL